MLKNVKLMIIMENKLHRAQKLVFTKWHKFTKTRYDLLTVQQSCMMKVLERILSKHNDISICKRFNAWKYKSMYAPKSVTTAEFEAQTDPVTPDLEYNDFSLQTDPEIKEVKPPVESIGTETIPVQNTPQGMQTDEVDFEDSYSTPDDASKKKKSEQSSSLKESQISNPRESQDFPRQIDRVKNIAKPLVFTSEQNYTIEKAKLEHDGDFEYQTKTVRVHNENELDDDF
jgi:hypothetical protein